MPPGSLAGGCCVADGLLVSHVLLWCLVIVLALVVLALARQVGVLSERVAPAGALMPTNGPKVGDRTLPAMYRDLAGAEVPIGGPSPDGRATLVLWVSPTCPVCKTLVPTAISLAQSERLRLVFASDGDKTEAHRACVRDLRIGEFPYLVSTALGLAYAVGRLPFAALIRADGILSGKGLVNTREHLESLVEAMRTGIASLQDYAAIVEPGGDTALRGQAS
jgi:methylamine dehydrogenase accessory protein MauD